MKKENDSLQAEIDYMIIRMKRNVSNGERVENPLVENPLYVPFTGNEEAISKRTSTRSGKESGSGNSNYDLQAPGRGRNGATPSSSPGSQSVMSPPPPLRHQRSADLSKENADYGSARRSFPGARRHGTTLFH